MAAPALAKRPCDHPTTSSSSCRDTKRHRPITAPAPPTMERHDDEAAPSPSPSPSQPLLPGLPDHLAQLCLTPLPPRLLHAVCRPWRRLLYAPSFPPFPALYALLEDTINGHAPSFAAYDPIAARWDALPPPPMPSPPPTLCHPSFLSRRLPLQCVAAAGRLVLVAGSTHSLRPALPRPLVFDPAGPRWHAGPRVPLAPRRWCAAGAARGRVFLAGGVGAGYDLAVARSGACWDPAAAPSSAAWEPAPPLRDGRFSRDAAEAVCSRGKVCMVSLRGRGAKEGAVLDLDERRWEDMPPGMLAGWNGPAAASPDTGDAIFLVDEELGALNAYDWEADRWRTVTEAEPLKGASEMAAGGGRVCVVADCGKKVVVVDVTTTAKATTTRRNSTSTSTAAPRMWEVEAPEGRRIVSLHVLPRMTRPDQ
ncbi:F-box/kelch-repeat protein SKIP25 [Lolium rigidum]|uniref:F-box/kelch-repeat protein SKIP25 n=1 Tax=Lolium rigidum TaxID=89674 RepID=UPI001F5D1F76|nr:F-box/kelch-repeat protein SKIP25 [Lolium rigidum]